MTTTHETTHEARTNAHYRPGDVAVHAAHGLAEILGIEIKDAAGRKIPFYVLKIRDTGAKVMVSKPNILRSAPAILRSSTTIRFSMRMPQAPSR